MEEKKFNYEQLFKDITKTFIFGDTYKAKVKKIGIKYSDFIRMRAGKPVSMEIVIKCVDYLVGNVIDDNDGMTFKNVLSSYIK